jgi:hypothetical protein
VPERTSFRNGIGYFLSTEQIRSGRKTMKSIKDKIEEGLEFAIGVSLAAVLSMIVATGAMGSDVD